MLSKYDTYYIYISGSKSKIVAKLIKNPFLQFGFVTPLTAMVVTLDGGEVKAMEPVRDEPEPWMDFSAGICRTIGSPEGAVRTAHFFCAAPSSGAVHHRALDHRPSSPCTNRAKKKSLFGGFNLFGAFNLLRKQRTKSPGSAPAPTPLANANSAQRAPAEYQYMQMQCSEVADLSCHDQTSYLVSKQEQTRGENRRDVMLLDSQDDVPDGDSQNKPTAVTVRKVKLTDLRGKTYKQVHT